jgi:hypothetical protein
MLPLKANAMFVNLRCPWEKTIDGRMAEPDKATHGANIRSRDGFSLPPPFKHRIPLLWAMENEFHFCMILPKWNRIP